MTDTINTLIGGELLRAGAHTSAEFRASARSAGGQVRVVSHMPFLSPSAPLFDEERQRRNCTSHAD